MELSTFIAISPVLVLLGISFSLIVVFYFMKRKFDNLNKTNSEKDTTTDENK